MTLKLEEQIAQLPLNCQMCEQVRGVTDLVCIKHVRELVRAAYMNCANIVSEYRQWNRVGVDNILRDLEQSVHEVCGGDGSDAISDDQKPCDWCGATTRRWKYEHRSDPDDVSMVCNDCYQKQLRLLEDERLERSDYGDD